MNVARLRLVAWTLAATIGAASVVGQQSEQPATASGDEQTMQLMADQPTPTPKPVVSEPAPGLAVEAPPATSERVPAERTDDNTAPTGVRAEDVLREFQQERPKPVPILPGRSGARSESTAPGASSQHAPARHVPDGYFVVDRAGRLVHEGQWWVIHYIADNNPLTSPEPPMKLLPNRMLQRMIHEAGAGPQYQYIVSGEVTEFEGENYLLLRKLLRRPSMGNLSR